MPMTSAESQSDIGQLRRSWTTTRRHRESGIRRDASGRIHTYARAGRQLSFRRFSVDTPLETVRRWRRDTRVAMWLTRRFTGTLAADIEPFLRQIADWPLLVVEPRQQL